VAGPARRRGVSPDQLWAAHLAAKDELAAASPRAHRRGLDRDALVIGFARRAATYKRSDLVCRDLAARAPHPRHRLQLVFAGRATPTTARAGASSRTLSASRRFRDT
jgi:starch phosphorylase